MQKGYTFATNGAVSAATLHALVDAGTLTPTDITAWTAKTVPVDADRVLIADSADSNALKSVTLANLLPLGSVTPGQLDPTEDFAAYSWRIKPTSGNGWNWQPGGTYRTGALVLQEVDADGAALDPYQIPVVVGPGTPNDTLWLSSTGISVLKGSAAAYALDVTGTGQFSALRINGAVPTLVLRDSDSPASAVAVYNDAGNLRFGAANPTTGGATNDPVTLDLANALDDALVLTATGLGLNTATPAYQFDCNGEARFAGKVTLENVLKLREEGEAPASGGGGEIGTLVKHGNFLYVCVAESGTNSWRRAALATY